MKKTNEQMKVIVTTGGSGGHVFPAEAISGELMKKGYDVIFVTDKRGQAFQGLKNVKVYRLWAESVSGRGILGKVWAAFKLYIGTIQAVFLMYKIKPACVIGVGGYASIPAVMAAHISSIPVVLHEQNAVLGRANRMLAKGTRLIATSFKPTLLVPVQIPQVQVGLPVRQAIADCRETPYPQMKSVFHLFVFGGSQGARFFSTKLPEALLKLPPEVRSKISLVQQVRPEDMNKAHDFYDNAGFKKVVLKSFFNNMPELLQKSHLIIGRGGAGTLTEMMVVGRPAIIVPLPTAADNHQVENARIFCDNGAGWMIQERDFNPETLAVRLTQMVNNPAMLATAAKQATKLCSGNAAEKMADIVSDIIKGTKK